MAIALVGTIGAVTTGASGAAITPAWGTSENRTAGNLLVAWVTAQTTTGAATLPATPSGWTLAKSASATAQASSAIYYKIATGADTAPTFALVASTVLQGRLAEYSGANTLSTAWVLDQTGNGTTTSTSPLVSTNALSDWQTQDLVIYDYAITYSAAATKTLTPTLNNGQTAVTVSSAASSTVNHYVFGYSLSTTGNNGPDSCSMAFTTTSAVGAAGCTASFKVITSGLVRQFPYVNNTGVGVLGTTSVSSYTVAGNVQKAGDVLLLHHVAFDSGATGNTISSVADNFGNPYTWSKLQGAIASTTGGEVWLGKPPATSQPTGAVTVTVTMTGTIFAPIGSLYEITGNFNTTSPIRTSAIASGSSTTASASYTPTNSGDLVLHFACQGANPFTAWPAIGTFQGENNDCISGTLVYGSAVWKSGVNGTAVASGNWTCVSSQWYVITVVIAYNFTTGVHTRSWTPIQRAAFW